MKKYFIYLAFLLFAIQCKTDKPKPIKDDNNVAISLKEAPSFNADSAFYFVEKQVAFGPRVPNSDAHTKAKNWMVSELKQWVDTVIEQQADLRAFDGNVLKSTNIIASFNPEVQNRILLCAHWDTRPFADQDKSEIDKPIDGANDGASGVGVLMEVARVLNDANIEAGVDIILFDAEDYGQPANSTYDYMPDSYCLGSQYWAKNPHVPNYKANFGILLDMVGAPGAVFTMEGTSINYANNILHDVWEIAHAAGYSSYFSYNQTSPITDDHLYVNKIIGIPTIDIIHYDHTTPSGFGWYWHTHNDNLEAIDKNTLKAVGQTLLHVVVELP